jgi:hypothetical protein
MLNQHPLLKRFLGIGLVMLGIVGLVLHFLQGVALILLGLSLLEIPWVDKKIALAKAWWKERQSRTPK